MVGADVEISPELFAAVNIAAAPVVLLETSGKLVAGSSRHYVVSGKRYSVRSCNEDGTNMLMLGKEMGYLLILR